MVYLSLGLTSQGGISQFKPLRVVYPSLNLSAGYTSRVINTWVYLPDYQHLGIPPGLFSRCTPWVILPLYTLGYSHLGIPPGLFPPWYTSWVIPTVVHPGLFPPLYTLGYSL